MDLNRLRVLAGLDEVLTEVDFSAELSIDKLKSAIASLEDKMRTMPRDGSLYADSQKALERYKKHLASKSGSKNTTESLSEDFGSRIFFIYSRCDRKSDKVEASSMDEAVELFAKKNVTLVDPSNNHSSKESPTKFIAEDGCEYMSYPLTNEAEDITDHTNALIESDNALAKQGKGDNPVKTSNHDSDIPKVTFMNNTKAANTLELSTVEFNDDTLTANNIMKGVDVEQSTKIKVPADVMKHLNKRLKELRSAVETYDDKGYDDKSTKSLAIECLEKIKKHLEVGNQEEYKMAQVYYGTLMSPIFDMFPTQLINFLHSKTDNKALTNKL